MLVKAIRIGAETGEIETIDLGENTLKAMYAAIGCDLVELVRLPHDLDMWMDENGGYREDLHSNRVAGVYARESTGVAWPAFKGDVVISTTDGEGETIGLDDGQCAQIVSELKRIRGWVALHMGTQD